MITRSGLYSMSASEYHADPVGPGPSLSASLAHVLLSCSPRHAWTRSPRLNPDYEPEESEAFDLGTACHAYLLEGHDAFVLIDAKDYRTKAAQEQRDAARAAGQVPLLLARWDDVMAMAAAARVQLGQFQDQPIPLTAGKPEQTLIWQEGEVWCRARLDWLHDDRGTIDDYKTSSGSANPESFGRTLYGMGYDVQAAFYLRGCDAVFGRDPHRWFRFVVQETFAPYAVAVVSLAPDALALAEQKVRYAIRQWGACLAANRWPGYPDVTCYAETPPWELTRWGEKTYQAPGIEDDGRPIEELLP